MQDSSCITILICDISIRIGEVSVDKAVLIMTHLIILRYLSLLILMLNSPVARPPTHWGPGPEAFHIITISPTFLEGGLKGVWGGNLSSPGFKGMKAFIMTLTFIPWFLYGYNMIGLIWPSDVSLLDSVGELRTSRESTLGLTSVTWPLVTSGIHYYDRVLLGTSNMF